jgi:phage shock protein PspC (stress-responsive transcriptional regulator)
MTDEHYPTEPTMPEPTEPPEPTAPEAEVVKETTLHRSTKRRMIGGVAGGIGERFDIDPNIVRVIFVVLTVLYGLGAAIYLAMWVLIPQSGRRGGGLAESEDAPPVSNTRLLSYVLLAGVVVAVVIVVATLGATPKVGGGFGALWLVFLAVLAIMSLRSSARQHMLRRFLALVFLSILTVLILISGAFLSFLAATGVPMTGGSGQRIEQPSTLAEVQHTYRTEFGAMSVDLRQVHFGSTPTSVSASVAAGVLTVDVPSDAIVYLKTHIGIGNIEYVGRLGYSIGPFNPIPSNLTTAASQRNAPHLTLDVQVGIGQIVLERGYGNDPYVRTPKTPDTPATPATGAIPAIPAIPRVPAY